MLADNWRFLAREKSWLGHMTLSNMHYVQKQLQASKLITSSIFGILLFLDVSADVLILGAVLCGTVLNKNR